ncbi:hypothetical protein EYF80_007227 [Liparis tanakae]|uniref:Uncharacterized protein n=1 Tax=Liparis tanakae TaxID=230148 RepID=A0A4Z2IYL3_9TELE|nr:hypothetical protein EYF80_007227 [Liparis tanakae]
MYAQLCTGKSSLSTSMISGSPISPGEAFTPNLDASVAKCQHCSGSGTLPLQCDYATVRPFGELTAITVDMWGHGVLGPLNRTREQHM